MYLCTYVRMYVCTYVRMYVCTYVRTYACMHVCNIYISITLFIYIYIINTLYAGIYGYVWILVQPFSQLCDILRFKYPKASKNWFRATYLDNRIMHECINCFTPVALILISEVNIFMPSGVPSSFRTSSMLLKKAHIGMLQGGSYQLGGIKAVWSCDSLASPFSLPKDSGVSQ